MDIETEVTLPFPRERVFTTCRDRLPFGSRVHHWQHSAAWASILTRPTA